MQESLKVITYETRKITSDSPLLKNNALDKNIAMYFLWNDKENNKVQKIEGIGKSLSCKC